MSRQVFELDENERILFKSQNVRHGDTMLYTDNLIITSKSVVLEKRGIFSNFKKSIRYCYNDIKQAIIGKANNGERQIELYIGNKIETFAVQSGNINELKTLHLAINDQLSGEGYLYDNNFYQELFETTQERCKKLEETRKKEDNIDVKKGIEFVGDVAKGVIKSGNYSVKGIKKQVNNAAKKTTKKTALGGFVDDMLDEFGIYDIQDSFTEIGNGFREIVGLKPKKTHEEERRLREREEKRKKNQLERSKQNAFESQVKKMKKEVLTSMQDKDIKKEEKEVKDINKELEALSKLKELFDLGVLSEEEFESKKKQILNLH